MRKAHPTDAGSCSDPVHASDAQRSSDDPDVRARTATHPCDAQAPVDETRARGRTLVQLPARTCTHPRRHGLPQGTTVSADFSRLTFDLTANTAERDSARPPESELRHHAGPGAVVLKRLLSVAADAQREVRGVHHVDGPRCATRKRPAHRHVAADAGAWSTAPADADPETRPSSTKAPWREGASVVAGAGFEPATFGL